MSVGRTLYQLLRADVLERTRRYRFLVTVAAAVYLGFLVCDGTIGIHLGGYRGLRNSAWVGMMMALCGVTFVSLAGFYVVKGSVERDRETGVGQILAGTPLSKVLYLAGKTLSNFVVLGAILVVLALAAAVLLLVRGEERGCDVGALLLPLGALGLPAMLFVAALAVAFECISWLRDGLGNVVYFFCWTALVVVSMESGRPSADVLGLRMAEDRIQADLRADVPAYNGNFTIGMVAGAEKETPWRWNGMTWTPQRIGRRLLPVGYAMALVLLASLFFDRFGATARAPAKTPRLRERWDRAGGGIAAKLQELALRPLAALTQRTVFGRMVLAELRVMILGLPWWWQLGAVGLWTASIVQPPAFARAAFLPWLWIWPMFLWSAMGTRENRFRTDQLLFSCPRPLFRQTLALWLAGVLVAAGLAAGILVREMAAGDFPALCAVGAGALFIPSVALAAGIWSGGSKVFEALYIAAWYLGPVQHLPALDFMGSTDAAIAVQSPAALLLAAGALVGGALLGRRRRLVGDW